MTRYVSPAIFAEGPTDVRFLAALLFRAAEEVLYDRADGNFVLADVVEIGESSGLLEPASVVDSLAPEGATFDLIFVHRDSDSSNARTKAAPWKKQVLSQANGVIAACLIFTIPVRMIEAWALADGDALRRVLGVSWSDVKLGVPSKPAHVEKIIDPKGTLNRLVGRLSGPRIDIFARLGEQIDLAVLAAVPSYKLMMTELEMCLETQGVIS